MALSTEAEAELEVLHAFYCKPDEILEQEESSRRVVTVKLDVTDSAAGIGGQDLSDVLSAVVCFTVPHTYPRPGLELRDVHSSVLTDHARLNIKRQLRDKLVEGEDISALEFCSFAQQLLDEEVTRAHGSRSSFGSKDYPHTDIHHQSRREADWESSENRHDDLDSSKVRKDEQQLSGPADVKDRAELVEQECRASPPTLHTALFHLDHMRSRQNYVKLIKKWVDELALSGRLIFCHRFILILMQGEAQSIKEYLVRNRTTNVDVDSRGRSCKERMLTVLFDGPLEHHSKIEGFEVMDGPLNQAQLQKLFVSFGLDSMYSQSVAGVR
ncbi:uncharacterized protein LOC101856308 [Aplysia californica]|uniref:Uncharacterized protein LOC101856308 n=1 Tax=Aplysia californica TaxID=6500 RepID=A0ABM0K9C5_APLCA|nr:uncharacterized protein LOC101856308 [Aplysia californica]